MPSSGCLITSIKITATTVQTGDLPPSCWSVIHVNTRPSSIFKSDHFNQNYKKSPCNHCYCNLKNFHHPKKSVKHLSVIFTLSPLFWHGHCDLCGPIIQLSLCWHGLGCLWVCWSDASVRWPSPAPLVLGLGMVKVGNVNPWASPEESLQRQVGNLSSFAHYTVFGFFKNFLVFVSLYLSCLVISKRIFSNISPSLTPRSFSGSEVML